MARDPEKMEARGKKWREWREANPEKMEASRKKWREANPEKQKAYNKAYNKAYYENNKQKLNARSNEWRIANPKKFKSIMLKSMYGISLEQWIRLFEKQGRVCAICGSNNWGPCGPHTDHCHDTKRVRGITCSRCNHAIGNVKDNPETALRVHQYLIESLI